MLDEDPDHHDKNDSIEEQDDKDGAQEGRKESEIKLEEIIR